MKLLKSGGTFVRSVKTIPRLYRTSEFAMVANHASLNVSVCDGNVGYVLNLTNS